jgi:hypothetical protein
VSSDDLARKERAAKRRERMAIHKARRGEAEVDFSPVCGGEAISLATRLSIESFSLNRQEGPSYARQNIPVRFVRRSAT